jgi:copper oxidase (laccase) domain-containing protein
VDDVPGCTAGDRERFFSFRRDGPRSGRHLAAIVPGS